MKLVESLRWKRLDEVKGRYVRLLKPHVSTRGDMIPAGTKMKICGKKKGWHIRHPKNKKGDEIRNVPYNDLELI